MANRVTYDDVIKFGQPNPNKNQFENNQADFILGGGGQSTRPIDTMNANQLRAQNQRLRYVINTWKENRPVIKEEVFNEAGIPEQFNKRIAFNDEKIRDLNTQIAEQEDVIKAYQRKFSQFEENLGKLMKLDKDIHSKLVNPNQSATLEKNVKNVMVALNSGASYGDVIRMIDSIKV